MKKDWTYKKLGEVAEIEYGTRVVQKKDGGSIYPVYGGGDATFKMDTYNREDRLVVARFAMSPKCTRFVSGKFFLNDSGLTLKAHDCLLTPYFNWHIIHHNDNIYRLSKGAAQKNLDVKAFLNLPIQFPPLCDQELIVRELDAIHGILEKKQEQLRELDNLAQAIFYDMFGDPITNPKQWEVKKLIELVHKDCPVSYGIVQPGDGEEKGVPVVRPVDLKDSNYIGRENLKLTTQEISDSYSRTILRGDEILICVRGTTGLLGLVSSELKGCNVTRGIVPLFFADDIATKLFIFAALKTPAIQSIIADKTYGATLKQINIKDLRDIEFPLPPLSLQQSFAAKIEAIEAQKQAVQQSIREVEALLAERMDHYFS